MHGLQESAQTGPLILTLWPIEEADVGSLVAILTLPTPLICLFKLVAAHSHQPIDTLSHRLKVMCYRRC
jgi:hypothetical protein